MWIASHKSNDDSVWRWLTKGYSICFEQMLSMEIPTIYSQDTGCYPVEFTSEMIKAQMKQPSAVIIKKNDFLIMYDEFSDAISGYTIE